VEAIGRAIVLILAGTIIIGGGWMLYETRAEPVADLRILIGGFIGSAMTYIFGSESSRSAVRAATGPEHR
jgi:hypothetical protein